MWLVVDLLGQISLTVKQRLKPHVPARTFLNIVRKEMPVTYPPGGTPTRETHLSAVRSFSPHYSSKSVVRSIVSPGKM
jgi:hypothetical protein